MVRPRLRRDVCIGHLRPPNLPCSGLTRAPMSQRAGHRLLAMGPRVKREDVSWGYAKIPLSRERAGRSTRATRAALFEAVSDGLSQCVALLGRQGLDQIFGNCDAEVDQPMAPAGVFGNS
jgi:hypothetical protein